MKTAPLALLIPTCLGISGHALAAACSADSPISIAVSSPPPSSTTETSVSLSGTACNDTAIGLASIGWVNASGTAGTTTANTSWDGRWNWTVANIPLVEGPNLIDVKALDALGNEAVASVSVEKLVEPPPPPPPAPEDGNVIYDQKIKITANIDPAIDRYNAIGFLSMSPEFDLAAACDQPITVTVHIGDEETVLLSDSVTAGAASTCYSNKIRAVLPGPDLREVTIQRISPTKATLYVYAHKGTYLVTDPALRDTAFLDYFAGFEASKLTVSMGGQTWSGWSDGFGAESSWEKQNPCTHLDETVYRSKVELRCNR